MSFLTPNQQCQSTEGKTITYELHQKVITLASASHHSNGYTLLTVTAITCMKKVLSKLPLKNYRWMNISGDLGFHSWSNWKQQKCASNEISCTPKQLLTQTASSKCVWSNSLRTSMLTIIQWMTAKCTLLTYQIDPVFCDQWRYRHQVNTGLEYVWQIPPFYYTSVDLHSLPMYTCMLRIFQQAAITSN